MTIIIEKKLRVANLFHGGFALGEAKGMDIKMSEKAKKTIIDMLKSDDMRAYFEELLCCQTEEIVEAIHKTENERTSQELQEIKYKLSEEQDKNNILESKVQKLEKENKDYK